MCQGDFFGVTELLKGKPRVITTYAATNCHLLVLTKKDFDQVLVVHNARIKHEK